MTSNKCLYLFAIAISFLLFSYSNLSSQNVDSFEYTGTMQTWTVPSGITEISVDMYGGDGFGALGYGGRLQASHPVTPGEVLEVYVGGEGTNTLGGFNGGGNAGSNTAYGGGGGASDIRRGGSTLNDRILVAGGGGGTGSNCGINTAEGGHGGDLIAESGCLYSCSSCQYTGGGGTQSSGGVAGPTSHGACGGNNDGTFGQGGSNVGFFGTGGGGGWYGGGSGCFEGAGGGSSYASTLATNVIHTIGVRIGNGKVYIYYNDNGNLYKNMQTNSQFSTLVDAISNAQPGDTILLLDHATESISTTLPNDITLNIPSNLSLTLDGFNLISNGIVVNNGNLLLINGASFENATGGLYKGSGIYTGDFINNGIISPGN